MAKNNTNRHYSLRKLKTGTASVAVALTVLGAGFANQTEVKANGDGNPREVIEDLAANNPAIQYTFTSRKQGLKSEIRECNGSCRKRF